jgi:hypothetical protein
MLLDMLAEADGATTLAVVADSRPRKARRFIGEHTSFNKLKRVAIIWEAA